MKISINRKGFIQHHKTGAGFTLVELLVVIAIIGILSTVAVVNLNSARNKAKETAALALLNSLKYNLEICNQGEGWLNNEGSYSSFPAPVAGTAICNPDLDLGNWPLMTEGYFYEQSLNSPGDYWYVSARADFANQTVYCQSNNIWAGFTADITCGIN